MMTNVYVSMSNEDLNGQIKILFHILYVESLGSKLHLFIEIIICFIRNGNPSVRYIECIQLEEKKLYLIYHILLSGGPVRATIIRKY